MKILVVLFAGCLVMTSAFDEEDAEQVRDFMHGINGCRGIIGKIITLKLLIHTQSPVSFL